MHLPTIPSTVAATVLAVSTAVLTPMPAFAGELGGAGESGSPYPDGYVEPLSFWSGPYAGITIGYGWGEATQTYIRAGDHGTTSISPSGGLGALTFGYNVHTSQGILLGLEGDLGLMDMSAGPETVFDGHIYSADFGPFWGTARARAGAMLGQALVYGTAGLAFMDIDERSIGNTPGETALSNEFRAGWVIGAGAELAVGQRTSLKVEVLHMDLGTVDGFSQNNEPFRFEETANVLRTGISYKF
ncbi:MAG: outer membrane beta-barrel protein [Hyphomicrobiaceae bacterium]